MLKKSDGFMKICFQLRTIVTVEAFQGNKKINFSLYYVLYQTFVQLACFVVFLKIVLFIGHKEVFFFFWYKKNNNFYCLGLDTTILTFYATF